MKKLQKQLRMLLLLAVGMCIMGSVNQVKAAEATITPEVVSTGAEDVNSFKEYTYTVPQPLTENDKTVVPVTIKEKGALYVNVKRSQVSTGFEIALWTDANCNYKACSDNKLYFKSNQAKSDYFYVSNPGTYYMSIQYSVSSSRDVAGTVTMSTYFVSSAERSLPAKTWVAIAPMENGDAAYCKVKIDNAGYIGITQKNTEGGKYQVALCKSQKTSEIESKGIAAETVTWYPVQKGTYYIKAKGSYNDVMHTLKWQFQTNFSAKNNKEFTINPLGEGVYDIKIKAEKTGLLTLSILDSSSAYITFMDSKKKAISDTEFNWGGTSSVAVQKNKTYYIRAKISIGNDVRTMTYSIEGASVKKNTSKSKAVTLKKNKTNKTLVVPGDTRWHYFKIKLSKDQNLNMSIKMAGTGRFKYELVKGSESYYLTYSSLKNTLKSTRKLSKGTYYLKIKMADKKSSGCITLKLK